VILYNFPVSTVKGNSDVLAPGPAPEGQLTKEGKDIETVRQFNEYFNIKLEIEHTEELDCCLCNHDIDAELDKLGVKYECDDFNDYFLK
jgi:hypothetical protein